MPFIDTAPLVNQLVERELYSCLIVQHGVQILDYYREPDQKEIPLKINSCTKSILSSLVSIAIDQGIMPAPDTAISAFFPQLHTDPDPRKAQITIEQLLTMSAGFNWTEFGGQHSFPTMRKTSNWIDFVLSQPLVHEPGTVMEYNSGCSQLLATILAQTSGQSVASFAEQHLFTPLGITQYVWETDPQGVHTGGFGLQLPPSAMLQFGLLYLHEGKIGNQQHIQSSTVEHATSPLIAVDSPQKAHYGWHWWHSSFTLDSQPKVDIPYYYALGFGGQYIVVVPSYELVVTVSADRFKRKRTPLDVFRDFVVPLLENVNNTTVN